MFHNNVLEKEDDTHHNHFSYLVMATPSLCIVSYATVAGGVPLSGLVTCVHQLLTCRGFIRVASLCQCVVCLGLDRQPQAVFFVAEYSLKCCSAQ